MLLDNVTAFKIGKIDVDILKCLWWMIVAGFFLGGGGGVTMSLLPHMAWSPLEKRLFFFSRSFCLVIYKGVVMKIMGAKVMPISSPKAKTMVKGVGGGQQFIWTKRVKSIGRFTKKCSSLIEFLKKQVAHELNPTSPLKLCIWLG